MSGRTPERKSQKLRSITIAGFKSAIRPVQLNLRDITVLAGANSAGKSTLMQPLLLIKQTLEKPFDPGGLAIDGPLARFTHADQFFSHPASKTSRPTFSVTLLQDSREVEISYVRSTTGGVEPAGMSVTEGGKTYTWSSGQILKDTDESIRDATPFVLWNQALASISGGASLEPEIRVAPDRAILVASLAFKSRGRPGVSESVTTSVSPASDVIGSIRRMIYLPGLRGNPERNYSISAAGPHFPGNFNDYVASIVYRWGTAKDARLTRLEENLKLLGLTWRVTAKAVDDTRVEVRVGRLPGPARGGAHDTVNIADVGFGVSQTLPVLVALLAATRDQLVFVEQPELHLHPRAQVGLIDIILQAAKRGVQVVIETHSSLLILALQAAIANGRITPNQVSLNWFTRDETGQTSIAEAQIGDDGSYGDWPEDFGSIELDLQDSYMTAAEQQHADA